VFVLKVIVADVHSTNALIFHSILLAIFDTNKI